LTLQIHQINIMSTIEPVKSSYDVNIQSATEIMIQAVEDLQENQLKELKVRVLTSLKLHRRYTSLPNMSLLSIFAGDAPQSTTALTTQVFGDLRESRPIAVKCNDIKSLQA